MPQLRGPRYAPSTEGALHISIYCDDATWSRHFELQISIVRDCIKAGESSSSKQCMITTAKRDDVEVQFFALEVVWRAEYDFQC